LARNDAVQKPEPFKPNTHGARRDEEALGKRLGELLEHLVFLVVEIARDLGEGGLISMPLAEANSPSRASASRSITSSGI
jgi:hypothetical protein